MGRDHRVPRRGGRHGHRDHLEQAEADVRAEGPGLGARRDSDPATVGKKPPRYKSPLLWGIGALVLCALLYMYIEVV